MALQICTAAVPTPEAPACTNAHRPLVRPPCRTNASNSDGQFDVLMVRPVSKLVLLTIFPKVFFGKHIPHPKIDVYRGKEVSISGNTKAFADGEYIDDLPIRINNIQNSLSTWLFV
jgi:diacylglycerol kinase family enzyme